MIEGHLKEIAQFLPVLEANLAGKVWVAGALSLADFAVGSTLVYGDAAGISLTEAPNVAAWMERLDTPAVVAGRDRARGGIPVHRLTALAELRRDAFASSPNEVEKAPLQFSPNPVSSGQACLPSPQDHPHWLFELIAGERVASCIDQINPI